jgi:hypothetical protein
MSKSNPQKAVKKSKARKRQGCAATTELEMALRLAQQAQVLDPEIQAEMVDMQPADGYINPYGNIGYMPPISYSPGNMIDGYMSGQMVNPET